MKKIFLSIFMLLVTVAAVNSQNAEFYGSGSSEMIFSFAAIDNQGNEQGNIMRWAPALNMQGFANLDFANTFGLFTGLGIRNVGFIYEQPNSGIKTKYRTYNLGIPVGIKIGKLDFMFLFAGYEVEFPFHYKEKEFENEVKDKFTVWFSDRVEPVQHSLMAGVQFPYGLDLKFKYYLTNFHNRDYIETFDGVQTKPYEHLQANIFYFSLGWNMFTNMSDYYDKMAKKKEMR